MHICLVIYISLQGKNVSLLHKPINICQASFSFTSFVPFLLVNYVEERP